MTLKKILLTAAIFAVPFLSFAEPVDSIINIVKGKYIPDARVALWTVKAQKDEAGELMLTGKTDNAAAKAELVSELQKNNLSFKDEVAVLPANDLETPWGIISISVACMRKTAGSAAELISQTIMGTPVRILERNSDMSLIQTPDNYLGYITNSSLEFITSAQFDAWKKAKRVVVTSRDANLYSEAKENDMSISSDLLLGNILVLKETTKKFYKVELPDGRQGYVKKSDAADFEKWSNQEFDDKLLERNAFQMMGRPYLWGGMSTKAADCSGFVKTLYFSNAVILQRDASQQALTGEKINCNQWKTDAKKGDLIFIGSKSGRVTHVAMYLEDGKYIHSSGMVKVNSMNPESNDYLDYNFLSMSRINGSIGTEGIIAVKSHPWYF